MGLPGSSIDWTMWADDGMSLPPQEDGKFEDNDWGRSDKLAEYTMAPGIGLICFDPSRPNSAFFQLGAKGFIHALPTALRNILELPRRGQSVDKPFSAELKERRIGP